MEWREGGAHQYGIFVSSGDQVSRWSSCRRVFSRCDVRKTMCEVGLCLKGSDCVGDFVMSGWRLGTKKRETNRTMNSYQFRIVGVGICFVVA